MMLQSVSLPLSLSRLLFTCSSSGVGEFDVMTHRCWRCFFFKQLGWHPCIHFPPPPLCINDSNLSCSRAQMQVRIWRQAAVIISTTERTGWSRIICGGGWQCQHLSLHKLLEETVKIFQSLSLLLVRKDKPKKNDLVWRLGFFFCLDPECRDWRQRISLWVFIW